MILLDTDVILDVMLDREPWVEDSGALLSYLERRPPMAFVAWHTLSNIFYLTSRAGDGARVRDFLVELTRFAAVVPTDSEALRYAAALPLEDFEDAMQVAAAHASGAELIATRNVAHFADSPVLARAPAEILVELG